MRTLKFLVMICLASFAAGSLPAQRPDSDLQSKAREALHQAEVEQSTPPAAPAKVTPPPPKKMKVTPPAEPVAPAAPVVAAPPPVTPGSAALNPETEAKAREQLRQAEADAANARQSQAETQQQLKAKADAEKAEHLRQMEARRAQAEADKQAAQAKMLEDERARALEAERLKQTAPPTAAETRAPVMARSGGLSPDAEARARESMRQALANLDSQQKTATAAASTQGKYAPPPAGWDQQQPATVKTIPQTKQKQKQKEKAKVVVKSPPPPAFNDNLTPAAVPAPVPGSKAQRLEDLKNRYLADQISPAEYHQQKAKILAEP